MNRLSQIASHLQPSQTSQAASPIHYHDMNPADFARRSAEIDPNALAVVHGDLRFTYKQFAERIRSLAWYFKSNGFKRIGIVAPNTPAHLETMFAANVSGGILMDLNYRLSPKEIKYMLELGEADLVVVDHEMVDLVKDHPHVLVDSDFTRRDCQYAAALAEGSKHDGWIETVHEENDLLGFFFTSGTTGLPKAVEYTHRGVYLAAMANIVDSHLNCQDAFARDSCRYLWTLPLFHAAGWTYPYAVTAVRGTHYCLRKIEPEKIWSLLRNERITHFNAAPTVNTMLVNSPSAKRLDQQVRVIVAASPPSAKLFQQMIDLNLVPVHMYGLTETYGPFTASYFISEWNDLPKEEMYAKMARQGYAFLTSAKLRVVDDNMNDVKPDGKHIGEIVVTGNIVTRGYYKNPEATAKQFSNGWFKSGDLAVVHPDGSCQVMDRKKDIIISGGENISSAVVEGVLVKHPAVLEVAVVGIPDEVYGEAPVAVVVQRRNQQLDTDDLISFAKKHLGGFQVPRKVVIVDQLPKTATGKVRKNVLRDTYSQN